MKQVTMIREVGATWPIPLLRCLRQRIMWPLRKSRRWVPKIVRWISYDRRFWRTEFFKFHCLHSTPNPRISDVTSRRALVFVLGRNRNQWLYSIGQRCHTRQRAVEWHFLRSLPVSVDFKSQFEFASLAKLATFSPKLRSKNFWRVFTSTDTSNGNG